MDAEPVLSSSPIDDTLLLKFIELGFVFSLQQI